MGFFNKKVKKDDEEKKKKATVVEKNDKKSSETLKNKEQEQRILPILGGSILQPRVSEKAGLLAKLNKYAFVVKKSSNKVEIKKAIEQTYKVRVTNVNVINVSGKEKRRGKIVGRTGDFKKAIVTLKKGDRIEGIIETA